MAQKAGQIFGNAFILNRMKRVLGGAQKHTYLAETENNFKFIIYIWDKSTSYFSYDCKKDVFSSSSAQLFEENNKFMMQHNVNVPKLYYMDRSKENQEYEYAFVEYIDGIDMDEIISKYPERLHFVLPSLKNSIDNLHNIKSAVVGQLNNFQTSEFNIIDFSFNSAQKDIDYLIQVDDKNKELYSELSDILCQSTQSMTTRDEYTFIHGELGPNHVIVDESNNAFLIDIEGAKYCDLEEETSFLKIRFGNNYKNLINKQLDQKRMEFYHLCHCLGNLSGAIKLKIDNYYDIDDVKGMINYFISLLRKVVDENSKNEYYVHSL